MHHNYKRDWSFLYFVRIFILHDEAAFLNYFAFAGNCILLMLDMYTYSTYKDDIMQLFSAYFSILTRADFAHVMCNI